MFFIDFFVCHSLLLLLFCRFAHHTHSHTLTHTIALSHTYTQHTHSLSLSHPLVILTLQTSEPSTATLPEAEAAAAAAAAETEAAAAAAATASAAEAAAEETAAAAAAAAANTTEANHEDCLQLLWLSQYQLLRAQVLLRRISTDGVHNPNPLNDLPTTYRLRTGLPNSDQISSEMIASSSLSLSSLPPTSMGPMAEVAEFLVATPLSAEGEDVAPINPSTKQLREGAYRVVDNRERKKKERREERKEREEAIVEARRKAEERGENPDDAEQMIRNAAVPSLSLQPMFSGLRPGFGAGRAGGEVALSPETLEQRRMALKQHRETRLLLREILLLSSRASLRADEGRCTSIALQCARTMWNSMFQCWCVCSYSFDLCVDLDVDPFGCWLLLFVVFFFFVFSTIIFLKLFLYFLFFFWFSSIRLTLCH